MTKAQVIESLRHFPNEFSVEELIEKLLFIEKVQKGIEDVKEGRVLTFEEAKARAAQWRK